MSWGVLYYAFPVLSDTISDTEGWSRPALTAAFSLGLVVNAVAGIAAGRIMQRRGPRGVMTGASVLGVCAVLVIATAPNLGVFFAGWVLAGVAMSGTLYAPAFAAVTVWFGEHRVRALTAITLIAGLASTVFAPLTALLDDHLGWRGAWLVLAAALALLTVPTHWVALRPAWPDLPTGTRGHEPTGGEDEPAEMPTGGELALLAGAFTVSTLGVYGAVVNLVPLLTHRGIDVGTAAIVLGLGGAGQVLGRLGYARLSRTLSLRARTVGILAGTAVTTGLLGLVPGPLWLLIIASVLAGNARGIFTLVQATALSDRWGSTHYARINGVFTAPIMGASAVAPFAGAGLADLFGSYPVSFVTLAAAGLVGAVAVAFHKSH